MREFILFYHYLPDGLSEAKCAGFIRRNFNSQLEKMFVPGTGKKVSMITARQDDAISFSLAH
jgi:hypothetical protein